MSDLFAEGPPAPVRAPARVRVPPSPDDVTRWHEALVGNAGALDRLHELRGWTRPTIELLGVGVDGDRVTIPVEDASGALVTLLRYLPSDKGRGNGQPKMKAAAGQPRELFPAPEKVAEGDGWILLAEGEPDAITGTSAGLAVVGVPGVKGWKTRWAPRFAGRRVAIVFDSDEEGRKAAAKVAADLSPHAADVRVVDLHPESTTGEDLTDFLRRATTDELRAQAKELLVGMVEATPLFVPTQVEREAVLSTTVDIPAGAIEVVPLTEFIETEEESAEPLLGEKGDTALPGDGTLLIYGEAGTAKTTKMVDAAAHLAAGIPWLGLTVPRPLRVLLIENEGPRAPFREKLKRKLASWEGEPFAQNVLVLEKPWTRFTFADDHHRTALAELVQAEAIDVVFAGPLSSLGYEGGGTLEEVRAFETLLADTRRQAGRPVAFMLIHHENKAGTVSGAWERMPDTLVHVRLDGRERSILSWQKVRWSPTLHNSKMTLRWLPETEGFEVIDTDELTATKRAAEVEDATAWLLEYVTENPGLSRGKIEEAYKAANPQKGARERCREAINRQLEMERVWRENGEYPPALATTNGESPRGTYLIPFNHADSPLAAPLFGEPGEKGSDPVDGQPFADSPSPRRGGESIGESADGVAA